LKLGSKQTNQPKRKWKWKRKWKQSTNNK